ncbi:MAG: phosphoribosylanthranilate isomerase [Clostridia bacterium]|nr:phosphoribosylanthranilate isomerase [Clostridia bacterium]
MTKIKICGLRRPEDIEYVNEVKADFAGFILSPKFWRYIAPEQVKILRKNVPSSTKIVGVVVDEDINYVASLINDGTIDIAQLHGSENEDYIRKLRLLTSDRAVITKVFIIKSDEDIKKAKASSADYVLLDSGTGTGNTFDWTIIRDIGRDYFLAGGLNPSNVGEAVLKYHPFAVDVSSGVETEKVKDSEKIKLFAQAVRSNTKA